MIYTVRRGHKNNGPCARMAESGLSSLRELTLALPKNCAGDSQIDSIPRAEQAEQMDSPLRSERLRPNSPKSACKTSRAAHSSDP